jgi:murein L,D-transpeptidase YcbB/YkuD
MSRARRLAQFALVLLALVTVELPAADCLQPTYLGTAGLEAALAGIQEIARATAWPRLAPGPPLRPGDRGDRIVALRARLAASGDGPAAMPADPLLFDAPLAAAIEAFQRRHGLAPDGKVGPATRAELDLTPADRARQIERTIASRRALPAELGPRCLLLNVAAFELDAIADGEVALSTRVVVGKDDRQTPTLASEVEGFIVHPSWNVPGRIARQEIAPRALRDPGYLERLGIEVFAAGGGAPVAPRAVDWTAFRRGELDLVLRQRPGALNALGTISFQFPNASNVCLHDTPERGLFDRPRRALSHGCVRLENAVELARWVAETDSDATRDALASALADDETSALSITQPVPIYIVEWNAFVDAAGTLQFRPELYSDRDRQAD